ncbi:MAG: peptidoglycan DD-metalloendopeptidase family protein [Bacteroidaceae bacterium]|nr:peptidoglycan DD-metalloendopeptidase family protein [Bacteroidaceae bacterium]
MARRLLTLLLICCSVLTVQADSKKVKDLKNQKAQLQKSLQKSKKDLDRTRQDVQKGQLNIQYLDTQIETRVQNIHRTEKEIDSLERKVDTVKAEVHYLDSVLVVKKDNYTRSLRMAQGYHKIQSSLLYALAAKDVTQMYRRLRYTREYASYQRTLGEEVQNKQLLLLERQNELLALQSEMNKKMAVLISERAMLSRQQVEQKAVVSDLKKKQTGLQKQVEEQTRQVAALQKKIDQVIAEELEQARKRAEEEARRKAEAERKKAATKSTASASSGKSGKDTQSTTTKKTSGSPTKWLTAEEQKLSGALANNKGRLPVPISGPYAIAARFGTNTSGLAHVKLGNKGVDYSGQSGARARSVFDGQVAAVFALGGMKNVLVRHGDYISVYCNLSSVIVRKGQSVKARDLLGTVAQDGNGNYTLHFELRKETAVLNPEQWIGR